MGVGLFLQGQHTAQEAGDVEKMPSVRQHCRTASSQLILNNIIKRYTARV